MPDLSPAEWRQQIRAGQHRAPTSGLAAGFVQAHLVILDTPLALEFAGFCLQNPRPLPVLDILAPGCVAPAQAADADLRTDLPKYRIYHNGALLEEVPDLCRYWRNDLAAILLGADMSVDSVLAAAGIPLPAGRIPPYYETSIPCQPTTHFRGPLVVSMRALPANRVEEAVRITAGLREVGGAPLHIGTPAVLGIRDLERPDWGQSVPLGPNDVPVFWASGITIQAVVHASRPSFMITHAPGHLFLTDLPIGRLDQIFLEPALVAGSPRLDML